jgi:hypothetical protein
MSSSRTITLFSERPELTQRPSSFVVSIFAHGMVGALLFFGVVFSPDMNPRIMTRRYTVRHLALHTPDMQQRQSASQGITYPGPLDKAHQQAPGHVQAQQQAVLRQTLQAELGRQTLVQPDILDPVKLKEETPIPTVIIWTPKKVQVKTLVAPLPEKATAAEVKPSVHAPNQELDLGDISMSSTDKPTNRLPVLPTNTSPLVVHGPTPVQMAPVTASQAAAQPTPTAVMSISDLHMPEGTVTLPPVNQTTSQNESGALAPGQAASGQTTNRIGGTGKEEASGDSGEARGVTGAKSGTKPGTGSGSGSGNGTDFGLTSERITLPKDGQFGAVVVGASLDEKYPEISSVWNDRMAYTVYLHVGLAKSWILQYSLPRASDAGQAGNVTRLEAPWPYNIVRPNIASAAFNSDAILVHGFVNQSGRFESLACAFPPDFQQAQFVLDALNQWQFRPAEQNGQTKKVEVLLIIPEEEEEGMMLPPN